MSVQLDWKAYFLSFCAEHGGNPVNYGNRLLFSDGWTYSGTDYAGPEWPPDSERLVPMYWLLRFKQLDAECKAADIELTELRRLQRSVSGILQQRAIVDGKLVAIPIDFEALELKLHVLEQEREGAKCRQMETATSTQ